MLCANTEGVFRIVQPIPSPKAEPFKRWLARVVYERMKEIEDMDHALYGEYFKRKGDRTRAQEELGKATGILRECGADGWVVKYEKELTAIS